MVCILKDIKGGFDELQKWYWNYRKMKDHPKTEQLEEKYQYQINWGDDEPEWQDE